MTEHQTTTFTRRFAASLRGVMKQRDITQQEVADLMGKSKGFVSEHTSGKRAVDSDLLDAVAQVGRMETRDLIVIIAQRMDTNVELRRDDETPAEIMDRARREREAELGAEVEAQRGRTPKRA